MNKIVVDANIIFSILISVKWNTRKVFLSLIKERVEVYAPEFLKSEILKYLNKLFLKRKDSYSVFIEDLFQLLGLINITSEDFYYSQKEKLITQMQNLDIKDLDYVALAYKLKAPLWTNDKKLKKVKWIEVINTEDLLIGKNLI